MFDSDVIKIIKKRARKSGGRSIMIYGPSVCWRQNGSWWYSYVYAAGDSNQVTDAKAAARLDATLRMNRVKMALAVVGSLVVTATVSLAIYYDQNNGSGLPDTGRVVSPETEYKPIAVDPRYTGNQK